MFWRSADSSHGDEEGHVTRTPRTELNGDGASVQLILASGRPLRAGQQASDDKLNAALGKALYVEVVSNVKAELKDFKALPPKAQKLVDGCLKSAALHAADKDSTARAFFNEFAGCVNGHSDVPASFKSSVKKLGQGL
ncbi:uncharacterized protein LOC117649805 [Thrips palmi]|uniref:Uncharacterized protein LOC117649805 n=1 Tax=Thrips palmi TaxID=161013 RepID=A0A6P8ZU03_THRPL|nr:uncharacterized protein LOC117649805 [Thrips palmi]